MNYIVTIRRFWNIQRSQCLGPNEVAVFFYLLEQSNSLEWQNPFLLRNGLLCGALGVSEKIMRSARAKLKAVGLLNFREGNGRTKATEYTLLDSSENPAGKGHLKGDEKGSLKDTLLGDRKDAEKGDQNPAVKGVEKDTLSGTLLGDKGGSGTPSTVVEANGTEDTTVQSNINKTKPNESTLSPARAHEEQASEAHIPTAEEVVQYGNMSVAIPEGYCRHYHSICDEQHRWIKNGFLIEWRKELVRWWVKDGAAWSAKQKRQGDVPPSPTGGF